MIRYKLAELVAKREYELGRRISLQEIAEATGINRSTISRMQNPAGHNMTTANLDLLCEYFGCAIQDLIEHVPNNKVNEDKNV